MDLSKFFVISLVLLVLLFGCLQPEQNIVENDDSIIDNSDDIVSDIDDFIPSNDDDLVIPDIEPKRGLPSPILCNDEVIEEEILAELGADYVVSRSTPAFGGTYTQAKCFVKKDNQSLITYSISEHIDNETALSILEDEKIQYEAQLFSYTSGGTSIGSPGYFFEQPTGDGSLYRVIFVDATNKKVVIIIKSNLSIATKEEVEGVARALEKVI